MGIFRLGVRSAGCGMAFALVCAGCRNLVTVPQPIGVVTNTALNSPASAQGAFYSARQDMVDAMGGGAYEESLIYWNTVLSDQFVATAGSNALPVDARAQSPGNEPADLPIQNILLGRSELLLAVAPLEAYMTGAAQARIGETFALVGYGELLLAEDYCVGVTLSRALSGGGITFGAPLTTNELLDSAVAQFDSALQHTGTPPNDTILALASVGLGRAELDLGNYAAADSAVANVTTGITYLLYGETSGQGAYLPTMYEGAINPAYAGCAPFYIGDGKGGTGLNYVSAQDPRLTFDSTLAETCDAPQLPDSVFDYPTKFGTDGAIPLMTGIEARLIQAEAALPHNGGTSVATWLADLNALRNGNVPCTDPTSVACPFGTGVEPGQTTGLYTLTDPGTDSGEVSLMFRERAFWLYGTGSRLGDMRRLIRQYGRNQSEVFPTGLYPYTNNPVYTQYQLLGNPPLRYSTDVSLLLPTAEGTQGDMTANPHYEGCRSSTATA